LLDGTGITNCLLGRLVGFAGTGGERGPRLPTPVHSHPKLSPYNPERGGGARINLLDQLRHLVLSQPSAGVEFSGWRSQRASTRQLLSEAFRARWQEEPCLATSACWPQWLPIVLIAREQIVYLGEGEALAAGG